MPQDFPDILIFGCGNMGGAMLRGWLAAGVAAESFTVVDPMVSDLPKGVALHRSAAEIDRTFDTLLLGIKPQMLASLAPEVARLLAPGALVISILAGAETATLSGCFPDARIVRLMPNLAAAIGKSPLGLFSDHVDTNERAGIDEMLSALGTPIWLDDESQMDAVTALAGSGPAFVYRFIDALAAGGAEIGLAPQTAARLAMSMVEGATQLAATADENPAELAARVTSPGGTTAAGLA
ncbi:MAG TPA: pyrroline-5-carboxylate reductase, partial [Sphingorhabdus sp.]|nr:pyrroline-5-carboxylate reductase [Sphingorhabdus sp.]